MLMTGNDIRCLMRINKVTIRQLATKMDITLKRIRHVRKHGTETHCITQDWMEAINA